MMKLNISIKLKQKAEEPNLIASVEITLNDVFVVHGIKIVKIDEKLLVKMPQTGHDKKIVSLKTEKFRKHVTESIIKAYQREIATQSSD